jgi:hypothetical protein
MQGEYRDEETIGNHNGKRQTFSDRPDQGRGRFQGNDAIPGSSPTTCPETGATGQQDNPATA